ncbi:MAG: DUF1822 family protein [Hydrococcus sp. Prado102]|jgi:hypothetical protein|nr:DUF1822 family protein [Hydrococcus sp. Prado102]
MNLTQFLPIPVLLDKNSHRYAMQFAAEQATPQKGKQVYLNTLAVCGVHQYLKWLSIPSNLSQSDCWHPGLRAIFNIADLVLPNIGKLECRPILPEEQVITIPPEASDNRIGYVAVRLSEELDRVELLGFITPSQVSQPPEPISVTQLQSLDSLLETIHRLKLLVNLRQWLEGIFQPEWQPLELLLASQGRVFRMASNNLVDESNVTPVRIISRGKVISWEKNGDRVSFILIVKMTNKYTEEVDICLQLYPFGEMEQLPPGLKFIVLDESNRPCLEAETRQEDNWIQLEFACQAEEKFTVNIVMDEISIKEQFKV